MNTRSDQFNRSRWGVLVSKHWVENRKRYGLAILGIGGLLLAWFSFILTMDKLAPMNVIYQYATYFTGLYITGSLFASTLFAELGSKRDGIGFLALPASHLEKLLCALLFGILLFFVVYTLLFYAVDIPMVRLANRLIEKMPRNWPGTAVRVEPIPVYNVVKANFGPGMEQEFHLILLGFFSVQSAFLLGSAYFTRYSFITMLVVLGLGFLTAITIQTNVIHLLLPSGWHNGWTAWYTDEANGDLRKVIELPRVAEKSIVRLILWAPPVLLWLVTWFRLKEKQV